MTNRIKIVDYVAPAKAEAPNPFIAELDGVQVGQAFAIDTTAGKYRAEKLQLQKAANVLGFTAREVENTLADDMADDAKVRVIFLARPARKRGEDAPTD